jgi:hypothetical protein
MLVIATLELPSMAVGPMQARSTTVVQAAATADKPVPVGQPVLVACHYRMEVVRRTARMPAWQVLARLRRAAQDAASATAISA